MTSKNVADLLTVGAPGVEIHSEFAKSIRLFHTERLTLNGCGNKAFKLTENLQRIHREGARSVLSFGGAWSNHLHAFAIACDQLQIKAVAAVRGEEQPDNPLLRHAVSKGLRVHYLSRTDYRQRHDPSYVMRLCKDLSCDAWLPEGGSNQQAVSSCRQLVHMINASAPVKPTHIALAVGTGATMAGIISGADNDQSVEGFPVVQDADIAGRIAGWLAAENVSDNDRWQLNATALPARYGKADQELLEFVLDIHHQTGVVLDPVYTGKAFKALLKSDLAASGCNRIVFVHTGGIGGCLGWEQQLLKFGDRGRVERYLADARAIVGLS